MRGQLWIVVLLFLLAASSLWSQCTATVTATVTDSDGTAWANGTYTAQYAPVTSASLTNSCTGQTITPTTLTGTLNSSGQLSITLADTSNVLGPVSGVTFTICPQMTNGSCYTTPPIVISGSSQDVSAQIGLAIQAPRVPGNLFAQAYNDTEVTATAGNQYFRLSDQTFRCYTTGWAGCGGGGGSMVWPSTPGVTVCTGTPCNAWTTSLAVPSGNLVGTNTVTRPTSVRTTSLNPAVCNTDYVLNNTLNVTMTLPSASTPCTISFVRINSGNATVSSGSSNILVCGAAAASSFTINKGLGTTVISNGTSWYGTCPVSTQVNSILQQTPNFNAILPDKCVDSSGGSTTAETCTMTETPQAPNCFNFTPGASNSTTGFTLAINGGAAISLAIPGASGYTTTLATSPASIQTKPAILCYDGTNYNMQQTGVSSSGGTSVSVNGSTVSSPNFNSSAPTADAGFVANLYKVSSSSIISESPFPSLGPSNYTPDITTCGSTLGSAYFVDQIDGNDSNNGACSTPFQTIAHLISVDSSTNKNVWYLISSDATSQAQRHWREQLTVPRSNMVISAFDASYNNSNNSVSRPLLDATDTIPNANWTLVSGSTICYQASITIAGWVNLVTNVSVNLYDAGTVLQRSATSTFTTGGCTAPAGSMGITSDTSAANQTIYIHTSDATSPISNGRLYEFSSRSYGLFASGSTTNVLVDSIQTRGNYNDDGSFANEGTFSISKNILATDGNKHNFFMGAAGMCIGSIAHNGYYGNNGSTDSQTLFISAGNDFGYTLIWDGCHAIQDSNIPVIPGHGTTSTTGFYSHNGPGRTQQVLFRNSTSKGIPDKGFNADAQKIRYENVVADGGGTLGAAETEVTNSKIISLGTLSNEAAVNTVGPITGNIDFHCRNSILQSQSGAGFRSDSITGTVNVDSYGCTYRAFGSNAFYQNAGTTGVINFNHDIFESQNGSNATVLFLNTTPTSISMDYNTFAGNGQEWNVNGSTYTTPALWQAAFSTDSHSNFYSPGCVNGFPCNVGFNGTNYVVATGSTTGTGTSHTSPTLDVSAANASAEICAWAGDRSNNQTISITAHGAIWSGSQVDFTIFPSTSITSGAIASACQQIPYYNSGVNVSVTCNNNTSASTFTCGWSFLRQQ